MEPILHTTRTSRQDDVPEKHILPTSESKLPLHQTASEKQVSPFCLPKVTNTQANTNTTFEYATQVKLEDCLEAIQLLSRPEVQNVLTDKELSDAICTGNQEDCFASTQSSYALHQLIQNNHLIGDLCKLHTKLFYPKAGDD